MKYSSHTGSATVAAWLILSCACLFAIAAMAAPAFASSANPLFLVQGDSSELGPGDYLWHPWIASSGPMNMVVNLQSQRAFVYRNGMLIGISTISSGKPGYETPTGTFTVGEKQKDHHSNKYDDAPMPYMQRLTGDGVALHGGHVRGYPASHGCIRLPMGFAAALFKEETRGMKVAIAGHPPDREETAIASRENARPGSQCCGANGSKTSGDLHAAKFSSGHNDWNAGRDSNAQPETPCCEPAAGAVPPLRSALPECAPDREANNEADNGADDGDVNHKPDQLQDNECNRGHDQGQDDLKRSHRAPPQDLPPSPS